MRASWLAVIFTFSSFILATGQVAIGTNPSAPPSPDASAVLLLQGNGSQGLIVPIVTTLGAFGKQGMVVFNSTTNTMHYHNGTSWVTVGSGGGSNLIQISGNTITLGVGASSVNLATGFSNSARGFLYWNGTNWVQAQFTLPSTTQALVYDPATSTFGFQPLAAGGGISTLSASGTYLSVTNPTGPTTTIAANPITNADISNTAAIAGSKINPNFGAQNISTTGTISTGGLTIGTSTWPANANGVLTNNGTGTLTWAPASNLNLAGDLSGTAGAATVARIQGQAVSSTTPGAGQVLQFVGGVWTPANLTGGGTVTNVTATAPISVANGTTTPALTLNPLADADISASAAIAGTKVNPAFGAQNITTTTGSASIGGGLNVGLSNGLQISNSGNFTRINNIATSFPSAQGVANTYLRNDGAGNLSWATVAGGSDVTAQNGVLTGNGSTITGVASLPVNLGGTGATSLSGLVVGNGTSAFTAIATGANGQVLTVNAGVPSWQNASGLTNPMTTAGDLIYGGVGGTPTRLATGTGFLKGGATPTYSSVDLASTDVTGVLPIANGGTGAATAPLARTSLGLGSLATLSAVASTEITDGTITDADISGTAAIAGSKITPNFGAQNVVTTGTLATGTAGAFAVDATGNITKIRNVTTSFPAAQGAANSVLTNDGAGNLTWGAGSGWSVTGNTGTIDGTNFIGTTDAIPFTIRAGGQNVMRYIPNATSPNLVGGYFGNTITSGVVGGAIASGGNSSSSNTVTDSYGFIGGGLGNRVGNNNGNFADATVATVAGGNNNIASGGASAILGGNTNNASGAASSIGGGTVNSAVGDGSFIGGGYNNYATGVNSVVVGGANNGATGRGSFVGGGDGGSVASGFGAAVLGGNLNVASGDYSSVIGGNGNVASSYGSSINGGENNQASGERSSIAGGVGLIARSFGEVAAGSHNLDYTPVGGANTFNNADRIFSIGNGTSTTTRSNAMTVLKGGNVGIGTANPITKLDVAGDLRLAQITAPATTTDKLYNVGGSLFWNGTNISSGGSGWGLTGNAGTVDGTNFIGTTDNIPFTIRVNNQRAMRISFTGATSAPNILAGYSGNTISSGVVGSAILSGGFDVQINQVTDSYSVIGGGSLNQAGNNDADPNNAGAATVSGGNLNRATSGFATVGGGYNNQASGMSAVVAGGRNATASGEAAGVLSGEVNQATGFRSAVVGGNASTASGANSFVGGGEFNGASGNFSAVSGGGNNLASGDMTSIPGGRGLFARSFGETAVGLFNTDYTPASTTGFNASDRLFVIGNGTDFSTRSNALTVLKSGNVGIGNANPTEKLDVTGNIKFSGALMPNNLPGTAGQVLTSAGPGAPPTWGPAGSGWGLTGNAGTNPATNFIGTTDNVPLRFVTNNQPSGRIEPGADGRTYFGYQSGSVGIFNTAFGYRNQVATTGSGNTSIGYDALKENTTGMQNVALSYNALGNNTTGQGNVAVGVSSLLLNTTGDNNVAIGKHAGATANFANANVTGSLNTFIGYESGSGSPTQLTNATAIGNGALVSSSNTIQLGNANVTTVNIGTGTTAKLVAGQLQITGGTLGAGRVLTSDAIGNATWQPAGGGGLISSSGSNTLTAGNSISTAGIDNAIFGNSAGAANTGNYNVFVGANAALSKTSGDLNTIMGWYAGNAANTATGNTLIGAQAGESTNGSSNTFMGEKSGRFNTSGGVNTFIGQQTGLGNTTGFFNTAIGAFANMGAAGLQNATAVGYRAQVNQSNSLVLGSVNGVNGATANTNVGIGTTTPAVALDIQATDAVNMPDGTTAQRPSSPVAGAMRYNNTENVMEYYNGTNWYFMVPKVAFLKDVKPSGTLSGTFNSGAFQTRDLNTLEGDVSFISLTLNRFTLPAGEYIVEASAPAYRVALNKIILRNISDGLDAIIGTSEYSRIDANSEGTNRSWLQGTISITSSKQFEIQHRCSSGRAGDGFGPVNTFGGLVSEIYTQVKVTKLR